MRTPRSPPSSCSLKYGGKGLKVRIPRMYSWSLRAHLRMLRMMEQQVKRKCVLVELPLNGREKLLSGLDHCYLGFADLCSQT